MNSSPYSAVRPRKLVSIICLLSLLSPGGFAQGGANSGAAAGQNGQQQTTTKPGGTPFPPDLNVADLIERLAFEHFLQDLINNLGPREIVNDDGVRLPQWVDPNGNEMALPQIEALVLVRFVLMAELDKDIKSAQQLQNLRSEAKELLIADLRTQAFALRDLYKKYQDLGFPFSIGMRDFKRSNADKEYAKIQTQIATLEGQISQGINVAANTEQLVKLRAELDANGYKQFLDAKAAYYQALIAANPLLAVEIGGKPFWMVLLDNSLGVEGLIKALNEYSAAMQNGLKEQKSRIYLLNSAGLWQLGGPEYAQLRAMIATQYGPVGNRLMDMIDASYNGAKAVSDYNQAVGDFVVAIASALPGIGQGVMVIQIIESGGEYIVALGDEKTARELAPVTGYQGVMQSIEMTDSAGRKFIFNIALGAAQIPGFIKSLKSGQNIKVVTAANAESGAAKAGGELAGASKAGNAAEEANAAGKAAAAANAANASAPAIASSNPKVLKGLEVAKKLNLKDVDTYVNAINTPPTSDMTAGAALAATNNLIALSGLEEAEAAARAAGSGLPQGTVDAILNKARSAGTISAYAEVPRNLAVARFVNDGNVILVNIVPGRMGEVVDYFRELGITVQDKKTVIDLMGLKQEINFAVRNGRLPKFTPAQLALLKDAVVPNGNAILKWYTIIDNEVTPIFDKQFIKNLKAVLERSAEMGDAEARRLLGQLDWNTFESAPPADPLPPVRTNRPGGRGEAEISAGGDPNPSSLLTLTAEEIPTLSEQQLQRAKALIDVYPPEVQAAVKAELQKRAGATAAAAGAGVARSGSNPFTEPVKKLSPSDLNKLAANPNGNPTFKSAVENEIARRQALAVEMQRKSDKELSALARQFEADNPNDVGLQLAVENEVERRGLPPKGGTQILKPNQQAEKLANSVKRLSDENLINIANNPNADPGLRAAVQNELARRGLGQSGGAQIPRSGDIRPTQSAKPGVAPANPSATNNATSGSNPGSTGSTGSNLAPGAGGIFRAGSSGNQPGVGNQPKSEKKESPANGSVGLNVQPGTPNGPALAAANVNPSSTSPALGTLTILPNGTLQVTPPNSSVAYQGTLNMDNGSISLFPLGTSFSAIPPPNPAFTALSPNLGGSTWNLDPNHSLTYTLPMSGLPGQPLSSSAALTFITISDDSGGGGGTGTPGNPPEGPGIGWGEIDTLFHTPKPRLGVTVADAGNHQPVPPPPPVPSGGAGSGSTGLNVANLLLLNATNTAVNAIAITYDQNIVISASPPSSTPKIPTGPSDSNPRAASARHRAAPHLQLASLSLHDSRMANAPRVLGRRPADEKPQAIDSSKALYSVVANGKSSGQAAELQVFDPTGQIPDPALPNGTVLEPVKLGSAKSVAELKPGAKIVRKPLVAFCVDYLKLPPEQGMLYRVVPADVQAKYGNIRPTLQAGRELADEGAFTPDGDVEAYKAFIQQYALWAVIQQWTEQQFTEVFRQKTKEKAAAVRMKWTDQLDRTVTTLAPKRWRDVLLVQQRAAEIAKRQNSQKARSSRPQVQ